MLDRKLYFIYARGGKIIITLDSVHLIGKSKYEKEQRYSESIVGIIEYLI